MKTTPLKHELKMLTVLKFIAEHSDASDQKTVSAIIAEFKVGGATTTSLKRLGLIEKKGNRYKWVGGRPSIITAKRVVNCNREYAYNHTNKTKEYTPPLKINQKTLKTKTSNSGSNKDRFKLSLLWGLIKIG